MDNPVIICPVCQNELPYILKRRDVSCVLCGSSFTVAFENGKQISTITFNGRKTVWAPPLQWTKLKQEVYIQERQLRILQDQRNERIQTYEAQQKVLNESDDIEQAGFDEKKWNWKKSLI